MKQYLISFVYEGWCQGPERMHDTILVSANSYDEAVEKIKRNYERATGFVDKTLD